MTFRFKRLRLPFSAKTEGASELPELIEASDQEVQRLHAQHRLRHGTALAALAGADELQELCGKDKRALTQGRRGIGRVLQDAQHVAGRADGLQSVAHVPDRDRDHGDAQAGEQFQHHRRKERDP